METKKIQVDGYTHTLVKYSENQRKGHYRLPSYRKNKGWALRKIEKIEKSTDI